MLQSLRCEHDELVHISFEFGRVFEGYVVPSLPPAGENSFSVKDTTSLEARHCDPRALALYMGNDFVFGEDDGLHMLGNGSVASVLYPANQEPPSGDRKRLQWFNR
jgi:hypothetical protein